MARELEIVHFHVENMAAGTVQSRVVHFPSIEGQVLAIHHVLWQWDNNGASMSGAFDHNRSGGSPASLVNLLRRTTLWGVCILAGNNRGPIPYDPPLHIIGPQLLIARNDTGGTINVLVSVHYTRFRVDLTTWAKVHQDTSRERG